MQPPKLQFDELSKTLSAEYRKELREIFLEIEGEECLRALKGIVHIAYNTGFIRFSRNYGRLHVHFWTGTAYRQLGEARVVSASLLDALCGR